MARILKMARRERMVRMVRVPHKSACVLDDTWLSRSTFLSTWNLFLSPKELRIN
jgi:hypothetical protein